jgi:putative PEP-CTERM system histidine kinase
VWRKFTEGTASRVEPTDLSRSLVRLVADIFQALSVTIWLVDDKKETLTLAASTSLPEAHGLDPGGQRADAGEVISHFQEHPEPVDIESSKEHWAIALRRWHPRIFPHGGDRVCVPLIGRGEVLGLIMLGDRVGGAAFSLQDFDMLKCVGDHTTASLLNVQLSLKLLQAKEFEAFQTMAAFFVHDLKNAASTLNLMLQNLPVHFDDPAFREDALRGVSKSVAHINHLVGRLSLLRHELKIQPVEADLTEVVANAIDGLEKGSGSVLVRDLQPLPKLFLDREQMRKVVTNLVLNATEAVSGEGQVRIATSQNNHWVILTVTDNGCGMSAEFLNRSLFRPFQTTKKSGLGIGMFQSKMIVEAHGGRITALSKPGQGTTFQVFLPVPRPDNETPHSLSLDDSS